MICNSKKLLNQAKIEKYAIPHFNIINLEWVKFILEKCNELNSPVILGVSEGAIKYMGGYKVVVNLINSLVEELNIIIPVVIHLDHGSTIESCIKAIEAGFTSVMIDASKYDLEKNIEITNEVVEFAKKYDVTVEAEVGHVGGVEDGNISDIAFANVEDAIRLCGETNIDSLAPAIGNQHGIYKGDPKLDFSLTKEISDKTNIPLVLHGGTGIDDEKLKLAIACGICKVNIGTELQIVWSNSVRKYLSQNSNYDPRKIIKSGENAIKELIEYKLNIFNSINKN